MIREGLRLLIWFFLNSCCGDTVKVVIRFRRNLMSESARAIVVNCTDLKSAVRAVR